MQEDSSSGPIESLSFKDNIEFSNFKLLSQNSHSILYQAQRYGKNFILKFLSPNVQFDPNYQALLRKEYTISLQMDHPNIIRVYNFEQVGIKGNCIVMEYVDGVPLDQWLSTNPSLHERKRVTVQLLDAIAYIHSLQIIHRDLKPSNILITRNGNNVKLIDFGFSDSDSYAIFKQAAGTYKYMSPEQRNGSGSIDVRSDIYSLGLLMKEIFPKKHGKVIAKCLKENPEDRYSNVHQLRADFLAPSRWPWIMGGGTLCFAMIALFDLVSNPKEEGVKEEVRKVDLPERIDSIVVEIVKNTQENRESKEKEETRAREERDSIAMASKVAKVRAEAEQKCREMKQAYDQALKSSEYQEHLTQRLAYLSNVNVLDFYRRTVRSNWTKEEYTAYFIVFEENNKYYKDASEVVKNLPSYTSLYYQGKDCSPVYDSLEAIRDEISKETTVLFDSISVYNGQFYQWSVLHLK